ncbi:hypothetical protein [Hymenobacter nivis]|uniref:Bypass of forespore C C-terminal domain-containing protein n=1 Tax=Hymenobacter nivis TaxID=1850093 RepID=A0A502GRN8_9BACT|nr:hypothetical protein [Hymenobacter nivis]TPG64591.1 hypothetical protein EAH73_15620 [Hymenobacter nivis]
MLASVLTLWAALLGSRPALLAPQVPTADTLRVVRGYGNQTYAWGTLRLRNGQRLRGYLPLSATGLDALVAYYPGPPDARPAPRMKKLLAQQVQWMQVQGQYSELMETYLAARRVGGPVELFLVRASPSPLVSFLGPQPVMGSPAVSKTFVMPEKWYLRRANGQPVLVSPKDFATQLAAFFADDPALSKHLAASDEGYRLPELEALVQRYNQHARP